MASIATVNCTDDVFSTLLILNSETPTGSPASANESSAPSLAPGQLYLTIPIVLFCLLALGSNTLVIVTICAVRALRSVTSAFLVNLAVSDLLIAGGVLPLAGASVVFRYVNKPDENVCQAIGFMGSVFSISSILTLVAIAIDRYHAIIHCLNYHSRSNSKFAAWLIAWIWSQSIVCSAMPFLGWGEYEHHGDSFVCCAKWNGNMDYAIFMLVTCFLLPLFIMGYCYFSIIRVARQHVRKITDIRLAMIQRKEQGRTAEIENTLSNSDVNHHNERQMHANVQNHIEMHTISHSMKETEPVPEPSNLKNEMAATIRLLGPILVLIICWLPSLGVHFVNAVREKESLPIEAFTVTTWLSYCNAALNPLLYAISNRRFRVAAYGLITKKRKFDMPTRRRPNAADTGAFGVRRTHIQTETILQPSRFHHKTNTTCPHPCTATTNTYDDLLPAASAGEEISKRFSRETLESFIDKVSIEIECSPNNSRLRIVEDQKDATRFVSANKKTLSLKTSLDCLSQEAELTSSFHVPMLKATISVERIDILSDVFYSEFNVKYKSSSCPNTSILKRPRST